MVVALLVNQFFPSTRGLERQHSSVEDDGVVGPEYYQELAVNNDSSAAASSKAPKGKRKPFRAMAALTSLASDFDVISDWMFFWEAVEEDYKYRQSWSVDGSNEEPLPYLIPPLLLQFLLLVCLVGTFMWLTLATDGRLVTPVVRYLGYDALSMGHMLLLCVLLEDIPQIVLTFLVEDFYEERNLSNYAIYNLMTSLYDTLIKIAEAYDERHDIVETGDWCKESIWAHKDIVTAVLSIPLPPSTAGESCRHLDSDVGMSVRGKIRKPPPPSRGLGPVRLPRLRFLTTSLDQTIRLWDTAASVKGHQRQQCVRAFRGHMGGVTCVALLGENPHHSHNTLPNRTLEYRDEEADQTTYFVTGCQNGTAKLWNLAGVCLRSYYLPPRSKNNGRGITSVAALVQGSTFLCGYEDKTARLWEAFSGVCIGSFQGHDEPVTCVASMRNDTTFVTGSMDGTVQLWDSQAAMAALQKSLGSNNDDRSPSPSGRRILTKESSRYLTGQAMHEESNGLKCFAVSPSHAAVLSVACVEPSKVFVSGSADAIARIWSIDLHCCLRSLVDHEGPVSTVLSIDRSTILTGSHDTTVKAWDAVAGTCLRTYGGGHDNAGAVTCVSVAEDDTTFLTAAEQTVKIWVVSSVPANLPDDENNTLDQILDANLALCRVVD